MNSITRHILTVPETATQGQRQVHYRKCGKGPPLLMVHQSPRSSAEYEALMQQWGEHFTCIAPDTAGFGQSDPLDGSPEIADFADALCAFLDALGVGPCAAYGFHSGAIILVTAVKRQPRHFKCLALGGYAVWTAEEMRLFGDRYLPAFHPSDYGEHLTWLWNRMLEQSWVFPWFDTREEARLSVAHADLPKVALAVSEMLDAGNAYQAGYGAILRAPRDIPSVDANAPPCLITADDADPLQVHIDRLGDMPMGWHAKKVHTRADHEAESLAFLQHHCGSEICPKLEEDQDEGWLPIGEGFIHWKGTKGTPLKLHGPGGEMTQPEPEALAIDVPGHGQSSSFEDIKVAIEQAAKALEASEIIWPKAPHGDPEQLYPDIEPDRFGNYLQRAWSIARAEAYFEPWYEASAQFAIELDPAKLDPAELQSRAIAKIRAGSAAKRWHHVLASLK
ncbi:MAG: alpha/beta fold hydrolase [Pseudomonadota bacterium]